MNGPPRQFPPAPEPESELWIGWFWAYCLVLAGLVVLFAWTSL